MEWISVKERLPEIKGTYGFVCVLVYSELWGVYPATLKYINGTKFTEWFDWNGESVVPPTHWMPLPEPPTQ